MDHRGCLELAGAASVVPVVLGPVLAMGNLDAVIPVVSIPVLDAPAPEQMKYASLAEATSHLMQVLNDPERIIG